MVVLKQTTIGQKSAIRFYEDYSTHQALEAGLRKGGIPCIHRAFYLTTFENHDI